MLSHTFLATILAVAHHALAASSDTTDVKASATLPSDAHGPIDKGFTMWSCEFDSFNETVGVGSLNTFTDNLIKSLLAVTNGRPMMRVGGTSGDSGASYKSTEPATYRAYPPSFFESFKYIDDIDYIFQVPLSPNKIDNTVDFFKAGMKYIGNDRLWAVEIGNEDNVYIIKSGGGFDYKGYVNRFQSFQDAIIETGLLNGNNNRFQAIDCTNDQGPKEDIAQQIFKNSGNTMDLDINSNKTIRSAAMHYYQTTSSDSLQNRLMSHKAIMDKMTNYTSSAKITTALNVPMFLDEVGSAELATKDLHFQRNMGAALWSVDVQLYSMVADIARVGFLLLAESGSSPWSAYGDNITVNPPYYAQQFAASFIGKAGDTKVSMLSSEDYYPAYAAYDGDKLARVALLNLLEWDGTGSRSEHIFQVSVPSGVTQVHVQRLSSDKGAYGQAESNGDAGSISWAGQQWTSKSKGLPEKSTCARGDDSFDVTVQNGIASVKVPATEAVIVYITSSSTSTSSGSSTTITTSSKPSESTKAA